jgi:hypothetical protein
MPAVYISFGYVNAQGVNDEGVVSPPAQLGGNALRDAVVAALAAANITLSEVAWVDGYPATLLTAVGTHLGIPVGTPVDWVAQPVAVVDDASDVTDALDGAAPAQSVLDRFGIVG